MPANNNNSHNDEQSQLLLSRIDERVKILVERQKEIDDQIEKLLEIQKDVLRLNEKVSVIISGDPQKELNLFRDKIHNIEVKMENFNLKISGYDDKWSKVFDSFWKVGLTVVAGYILYKLGISGPP